MAFRTAYKAATGSGTAKQGVAHFISQRLTAMALIPLGAAFVYSFSQALGTGQEAVLATYRQPFEALVALGFFLVAFRHLRLGMQVVIEDYIHAERARLIALIANALVWRGFAVTGAFAVLRIALS